MLQSISEEIERKMIEFHKNEGEASKLIELLSKYRKGQWLYPGVLIRKFDLSMIQVYELLEGLRSKGFLKKYYELRCSHCQRLTGEVTVFNKIPKTFDCECCGFNETNVFENAAIVYQVMVVLS